MILKLLIVEDHPAMIEGYKSILANNTLHSIEYTIAQDCESAYKALKNANLNFDIVFLDLILPPAPHLKLVDGEDVAKMIRKILPDMKIIVLTSHAESFALYSIVRNIVPEGLLVKSDFSGDELLYALDVVQKHGVYHSATVKKGLKDFLGRGVYLDACNRKIIILLSQGIKTKNLPQYLNLSVSAIDKRKAQIKDFFNIEKGNDEDILREARKCGFI